MVQVCWLLVLVAAVGSLRDIEFKNCKSESGSLTCKVKSVEISGCLAPSSWVDQDGSIVEYNEDNIKSPCRIDRGSTLNFSISFEPGFSLDSLRSQITVPELPSCWSIPNHLDSLCPVPQSVELGCSHTKCPLLAGRQQTYDTSVQVSKSVSSPVNLRRIYQMRWKLWNNKNKKNNCCFNIPIQY